MSVLYSETFTGPNANPIGGVWTTITGIGAMQRISNTMDGQGTDSGAYVSTVTPPNDQYAKVTLASSPTTDGGPAVRIATGAETMYVLDIAATTQIVSVIAGSFTALGTTFSYTFTAGDVWELDAVGTTLTGKLNGVAKVTATDSNITSGRFGAFINGGSMPFSKFEGGDFGSATLMGQMSL